eukprot:c25020_g1_i1 orf=286-2229(+)
MMKAAEATDSLRASKLNTGKLGDNLPCNARDLSPDSWPVLGDKNVKRGGESISCAGSTTLCKLPKSHADDYKKGPLRTEAPPVDVSRSDSFPHCRDQVVQMNLVQAGGFKSKCAPMASVGSMERRRRCSCGSELNFHSSNSIALSNGNSNSSCNCNMENCEEVVVHTERGSYKSLSWRSSSDQSNTNAALHRALAAMKKVSGEPDAVKKSQQKSVIHHRVCHDRGGSVAPPCDSELNARSITNSDARTLSMRERGRWGNSKMQQQLFGSAGTAHPSCVGGGGGGQCVKPNLSSDQQHHHQHHHHQPLQHVQCLHCGSFSTTPALPGGVKGTRSHSFGRRVRDYSWQQELLQEQKRPEQPQQKEVIGGGHHLPSQNGGRQGVQCGSAAAAPLHHQCEYVRCADVFPAEYELGNSAKLQHQGSIMSWQERYMLLCQAIAAGAFVDGGADDSSGPLAPPSHGYSWAVCECAACEVSGAASFRGGQPNFSNTSSGERMMELEAFSGPLGYVSESKGAELSSIMEKGPARRGISRWWARLPSFGKAKSSPQAGRSAGQNTAQCSSCGQRVWATSRGEEELGRLCPDCHVRAGGACESGPIPPPGARPAPPSAARPRPQQPPSFNFAAHHKNLPRRWRLMKLCRYLMGFPLQR